MIASFYHRWHQGNYRGEKNKKDWEGELILLVNDEPGVDTRQRGCVKINFYFNIIKTNLPTQVSSHL
jgi:hypothetical protein